MKKIRVFLLSSGLGHVHRGYESFTQECFDAVHAHPELDLTLFKGGGSKGPGQITLWNFPRNGEIARRLGAVTGRGAYHIEQVTFCLSLLPWLVFKKPEVIFFSDGVIGNVLWYWRSWFGFSYKLLFSNGGPLAPPFDRCDHVQQLAPQHLEEAVQAGVPRNKQTLLPYGFHIPRSLPPLRPEEKINIRRELGLPEQTRIILSVGAINRSHKRMDYLIREVAALPAPRPHLVLLGQQDAESSEIIALADHLLPGMHTVRTVSAFEMKWYYLAADAFVLASVFEGFGRVIPEAMSFGLPCLVHDSPLNHYILSQEGWYGDLRRNVELARLLPRLFDDTAESARQRRHAYVREKFSWERLADSYVEMIERCRVAPQAALEERGVFARAALYAVKRIFHIDYINRSYSQEGEDLILLELFPPGYRGFYVDVGAHHPKWHSNTQLLYQRGWRGINIDAAPGSMALFRAMRPRDINLEVGVDRIGGSREFLIYNDPLLSTFDETVDRVRQVTGGEVVSRVTCRTQSLNDILAEHLPPHTAVDLLTIDIEGLDDAVLMSLDFTRYRPRFIISEVFTQAVEDVQNTEISRFLREKGYRLRCRLLRSCIWERLS